ncbi:unnamed protein product [Parnassius apollo]|uniref:(apollo) hypothetical protein n=1 Tax=Parnassius apollo TaxID=110799 RepID=A0A8S3WPN4_PARAO|nr:unnamed protein product [Parnassius apollo]
MDKRIPGTSLEQTKRDKVYTTQSLYMDTDTITKLFIVHTYNLENSNGEEYLIRLRKWMDGVDESGVNRLVFVSGPEPHIPIYRTRLHISNDVSERKLSSIAHSGARVVYTTYNGHENVGVTRVSRGTFNDAQLRSSNNRGELVKEVSAFGLQLTASRHDHSCEHS